MIALVPAPHPPTRITAAVPASRARSKLMALGLVALLGLVPGSSEARRRPRATGGESSMRVLINEERAGGARLLRMRPKLIKVARRHSRRMANAGSIFHNPNLGGSLRKVRWRIAGENVGVGSEIGSLHQAFMQSPSHRENILRREFGAVGIGTVYARDRLWVTVVFIG